MVNRKAAIGLSMLCALLVCAAAAQSAGATAAVNTTPFTCVKGGGAKDFKDAHCDEKTNPGNGEYGHVAIENFTFIAVGNAQTGNKTTAATPVIFNGFIFGVKLEITCTTSAGEGSVTSSEPEAKRHVTGMNFTTNVSSCTLNKPGGFGCKVKEPIEFKLNGEAVEGLGPEKNEMGLELKPTEGEVFTAITIEGCIFEGTFKVTGTAVAVGTPAATEKHSGATFNLTKARTKETLKLGGSPFEISSAKTIRMGPLSSGNPIALTTST